ncbi:MAG: putative CRISPR-associated protein [Thiothrix sp.]|nr:MAG: putative CRISPR-associated protein [Thiothrix sp.]
MPNVIISTCGTSILTNNIDNDLRSLLNRYTNLQDFSGCPEIDRRQIEQHIVQRQQLVSNCSDSELAKLSAEMNALLKFYNGQSSSQDMHILLHTDTWLGRKTGETLRSILENRGFAVDTPIVPDLRTDNVSGFQLALSDLVRWASETIPGYTQQKYRVIFNLTGGFKSIQGFMQALAMLYTDESIYVFETGSELLHLPRLPLRMDAEQFVRDHLKTLRQLGLGLAYDKNLARALPETFVLKLEDDLALSPWGELIWQEYKNQIYRDCLYDSPSENIVFTTSFLRSIENLSPDRYVLLNQQIDKLAQYLSSNRQKDLSSLDLKKLTHTHQGSTHEFDAWHDQNAKRVFGKLEGNAFTCERLDNGIGH